MTIEARLTLRPSSSGLSLFTHKPAFVGYVVLVYKGVLGGVSFWKFVVITVLFIAIQIGHDDYLRIVLNRRAERLPKK